jgi:hypothetical protein
MATRRRRETRNVAANLSMERPHLAQSGHQPKHRRQLSVKLQDSLQCEREDMNFGFFVQQLAEFFAMHLARRPLDPARKSRRATSSQQRGRTI